MAQRHTKVTRRPGRKKCSSKAKQQNNHRRQKNWLRHEYTRKLARKLSKMATLIDKGEYQGIANSPLLHLNWDYVIKRSLLANSSWKKSLQKS
jgi:hypothetical protein